MHTRGQRQTRSDEKWDKQVECEAPQISIAKKPSNHQRKITEQD